MLIPVDQGPEVASQENNDTNATYTLAPGQNSKPVSIFTDTYSEELCFYEIFIGTGRKTNLEREVPVNNNDIVKSEIQNTDRRVAQNIPNLFYKLRKAQIKHVSGKAMVAMRKKGKNVKSK